MITITATDHIKRPGDFMETRHLRVFVAVYKTKSFTKAAELLFTSQPTISEHMHNLEDQLGCRLFDRLGRSIAPTPEAQILFPKAVAILDEMDKLKETLAVATNTIAGDLVIGASTIPGAYLLPKHAAAFKQLYSGVSFEISINDSSQIINGVAEHRLYLGVVGAQIPSSKLEYIPFGGDELVLAARADHRLPSEIKAEELEHYDFLLREEGSGTGRNVEQFLGQAGILLSRLRVRAKLGSSTAVKEAIKAGLGVAIISSTAIHDELAAGTLKVTTIAGLVMHRSFYIVTASKRTMPNHYQVFVEYLKKTVA